MTMWNVRAAVFTAAYTVVSTARRYLRPARHHIRRAHRSGVDAIRADLLILRTYNERVRSAGLSLETSNWDTIKTRRLRAKLASAG